MIDVAVQPETDLTPEAIASVDPAYWAQLNAIKLQSGRFGFEGHEYQVEPMSFDGRRKCMMKGAQGGFTEDEILIDLHGCITGRYPLGVLHMMPTSDDVSEFSKSRFGPLVAANRRSIGRFVRDTDTTSLKKVGSAFLYLRGARLNQKIEEDSKESSKLRSISVDRIVFDEYDLMDPDVVEKARGRMGHSHVKEEVFLSNPTLPEYGIDVVFRQSDQRHWFRKCESCGEWTCAELAFPGCVKYYTRSHEGRDRGYIACGKCGRPVGISPGKWVAQVPSNTDIAGYHWSELTSTYSDPAEILEAFNDPPENNLADVYRFRLGLPYASAEDRLQESVVYGCCGDDLPPTSSAGPCAMGVDVGKIKHVVIGQRTGNDRYEILRATTVSEWSDLHDLAKRYGVRSAVVDIWPYEDSARQFQKTEPYPIWLCEYAENMPSGPQYNEKTRIVKVNRTEVFDGTHRMIATPGMLRVPRVCLEVKLFAAQCCGTAKYQMKDKRSGTVVFRYKPVGSAGDHFRNALNYFMLAASPGKVARADRAAQDRPRKAINHFRVGVN
jgi:hypothetical protein